MDRREYIRMELPDETDTKKEWKTTMRREVSLADISDGKLYDLNDMVRADAQGCSGCSACCRGMGSSVVLDPLDLYRLARYLKTAPRGPGGGGRAGSAPSEYGRGGGAVSFPGTRWPVPGL